MQQKNSSKIILGIDVGFARTGWGVVEKDNKHQNGFRLIDYGCIETHKETEFVHRLQKLQVELRKVIKKYKPEIAHVEDLFFFKNLKTAIKVAQARGVILITLSDLKVPIKEYTPLQVKQSMTGYGRATKQQIQELVKIILNMNEIPKPDDAADALALAMV